MGKDSTKRGAQSGEVPAGDSSKKTAIACNTCGNTYRNNHAFAGHRRYCKSTKEPEQNAIELAKDQHADKVVDRNSEEVTTSFAVTTPEKDCKFTNGLELNEEGQAGVSPARKIRNRHSCGRNLMDIFGSISDKSTKKPEQNALKLAEDQSAGKMTDRNSEEVTAKSEAAEWTEAELEAAEALIMLANSAWSFSDDEKEQLSSRSLADTSLEKEYTFTNGPEQNMEGQATSQGHQETKQHATELVEDQSTDKIVARNSEEVTAKSGSQLTEAEREAVEVLMMLPNSVQSFTDDEKEQLSSADTSLEKDYTFTNDRRKMWKDKQHRKDTKERSKML